MKLDVIELIENVDGSATLNIELDVEATKMLINKGLNCILLESLKDVDGDKNEQV